MSHPLLVEEARVAVRPILLMIFLGIAAFVVGGLIAAGVCLTVLLLIWAKVGIETPDKHGIAHITSCRLGGLLVLGYTLGVIVWLQLVDGIALLSANLWLAALACICIFAVGLVEDITGLLKAHTRLLLMSAVLIPLLLADPNLPLARTGLGWLDAGLGFLPFGLLFTLLGILFLINAFNAADGANGLLSGICLIAVWILLQAVESPAIWALYPLWVGLALFFLINLCTGKLFLGDSGAYFLGTALALVLCYVANAALAPTWLLLTLVFYPTADFLVSVVRRLCWGGSVMAADNYHFHNMLYAELCRAGCSPLLANSLTGLSVVMLWSMPTLLLFRLDVPATTWPWLYGFYSLAFMGLWAFFYFRSGLDRTTGQAAS